MWQIYRPEKNQQKNTSIYYFNKQTKKLNICILDLSKQLAYRIKNSHDRKNHRLLAYTKSDSDMMKTFGRHKFFRYKIKSDSSVILKENESESPDQGM